jgi:tetratricopeptide (TPR) repeat protein
MPLRPSPVQLLVLAGLCLSFEKVAVAQTGPVLSTEYAEMVRLYAAGDSRAALALLGGWSESRIREHNQGLREAVVSIRKCPSCPIRQAFSKFPVRAALLLHADREIHDQFSEPVSEQESRCGTGPHATIVDHRAAILLLIDPLAQDFLEPLYLGIARHAEWSHCLPQSQQWARAGLRLFPKDIPLLMALGIATESNAFFTLAPAPLTLDLPPSVARQRDASAANLRGQWENALRAFEDVVAVSPDHVEARLRLGRILWRLGKLDAARTCLEAVLGGYAEASLQYLAHLFLGRVLEDNRRWPEAEEHNRVAMSIEPLSETAAVALSHVRFLQGDTESARAVQGERLVTVRLRTTFDPWVPYLVTQSRDGERILAGLRQAVRQ